MGKLRQVFVCPGFHTPLRRLGSSEYWMSKLPNSATQKDLHRGSIVLPRGGDGHYAAPTPNNYDGTDGHPWGELTSLGIRQMRAVGCSLHPALEPSKLLIRTPNRSHTLQSAMALARGLGDTAQYPPVYEVLIQNGDHLELAIPSSDKNCLRHAADTTLREFDAGVQNEAAIRTAVSALIREQGGVTDFDVQSYSWEELCIALECFAGNVDGPLYGAVDKNLLVEVGRITFARCAAPFYLNPPIISTWLGPLARDIFHEVDTIESGQDLQIQLFVVPRETLVALTASLGLAKELAAVAESSLGPWPALGSVLEFETSVDSADGVSVAVTFQGHVLNAAECKGTSWAALREGIGPLGDICDY